MTLTKQDLDDYRKNIEESHTRMTAVLKEVASQFSCIGQQLVSLAKSNEGIQDALVEHVFKPLADALKQHHDRSEKFLEKIDTSLLEMEKAQLRGKADKVIWLNVIVSAGTLAAVLIKTFIGR